ncbi:DUF7507 domain-containing protein [Prescottella agglutinans]|nr:hypothetical protein [Prescottella agglutinans]
MATITTATVGAGTALAAPNLSCDMLYSVNSNSTVAKQIDPTTGNAVDAFPVSGTSANQVGIGPGGAYAVYTSGTTIYKYDAASGRTTSTTHGTGVKVTHGAINPATGIFYFGGQQSGDSFKFAAYDPAADRVLGVVLDVTVPSALGGNGDIAFDALGNMYIVAASTAQGSIYVVPGPIPTSGSNSRTATAVTSPSAAFKSANSVAFGPGGYLYVGSSSSLVRVDPSTGKSVETFTNAGAMTDMGSCTDPVSIELHKNLPSGRVATGDQFGLAITGGGLSTGNTSTTTGTASGMQPAVAGPVLGLANTTYTITETGVGATNLAGYKTTWQCVDATTSTVLAKGDGTTGQVTTPASGGVSISCTFTNTSLKSSISLLKTASPQDPAQFEVGRTITYNFAVKNTGDVPLKDVKVEETAFTGSGAKPTITCPAGAASLAPGATVNCSATYVLTQADVDRGTLDNTAKALGTDPSNKPVVSDPSSVKLPGDRDPRLSLVKSASPNTAAEFKVGQEITYSFAVKNTGNVTVTDVKVVEDKAAFTGSGDLSAITCPDEAKSLAPGETVECKATYTVTQADVDRGSLDNTATAEGTPPADPSKPGEPVEPVKTPPSSVTVPGDRDPVLELVKTATPNTAADFKVGETITYNFAVTNKGNVTVTDVKVTDTEFTGAGTLSEIVCPVDEAKSLAPGATVNCSATYVLQQADIDRGTLDNTATAEGTPPADPSKPGEPVDPVVSPPSKVTVPGDRTPGLTIEKTASPNSPADFKVGQEITYSFAVTNIGNVTITDVKVSDIEFTGSGALSPITCPDGAKTLAPNETVVCTATYTITQADVDAGKVDNTATAVGTPPGDPSKPGEPVEPIETPPSNVTVPGDPQPGLSVVKTASVTDSSDFVVGNEVTYKFVVTNTGDVTLTDVKVDDTEFTGSGELSEIACPTDEAKSLAPGASMTCTATYTLTQADIDAGTVENSATATGTPPGGGDPVTTPPSKVVLPGDPQPGISIVKDASPKEKVRVGQVVTYRFVITNTGDVTLTNVHPNETEFTGSGVMSEVSCPDAAKSLAPGESVTCTATYTITKADVKAGRVDNVATVTGTNPQGDDVVSGPSNVTVTPVGSNPGIIIIPPVIIPGLPGIPTGSTGPGGPGGPGTPVGNERPTGPNNPAGEQNPGTSAGNSDPQNGALIDSGLGADSDGGMNAGLVAGGLVLLVAAGGVLFVALRRRSQGNR